MPEIPSLEEIKSADQISQEIEKWKKGANITERLINMLSYEIDMNGHNDFIKEQSKGKLTKIINQICKGIGGMGKDGVGWHKVKISNISEYIDDIKSDQGICKPKPEKGKILSELISYIESKGYIVIIQKESYWGSDGRGDSTKYHDYYLIIQVPNTPLQHNN